MNLTLVSFDGTAINDGTNFIGSLTPGQPILAGASLDYIEIERSFPYPAQKNLSSYELSIDIEMRGSFIDQVDTLKALFRPDDFQSDGSLKLHTLIAQDDSANQWYLSCYTVKSSARTVSMVRFDLALKDAYWRKVTATSDTWNVASANETHTIHVTDSYFSVEPIFTITLNGSKSGGYKNRNFARFYNPTIYAASKYPIELTNSGWNTSTLVADTSKSNQINNVAGYTSSATTLAIDTPVGGGLATTGGMCYCSRTGEQMSYTAISAGNMTGITRGIGGTTAAALLDNDVLVRSQCLANGDDIRVFDGGVELDRWLYGMNSATTKVWVNLNFSPAIEMTLGTAISNVGSPSTITIADTKANKDALTRLPVPFILEIDSERFIGTGKNISTRTLSGITRAQKNTSNGSHSVGTTVRWIEHDLYVVSNNVSATTPSIDNTVKPMIDLSSTNASWIYYTFYDEAGLRSGCWTPFIEKTLGGVSRNYTGPGDSSGVGTIVDPATEMGMSVADYQSQNVWKAEDAAVGWRLIHPFGITDVNTTGRKYRYGTSFPSKCALQKKSGKKYVDVYTEATPSATQTWENLTNNSSNKSLSGTYYEIRDYFSGSIAALANNIASYEIQSRTLTLPSASVPQVSFASMETVAYYLDLTLSNETTGDVMILTAPMKDGDVLTIDCGERTITNASGESLFATKDPLSNWLSLATGDNTLRWQDTGTTSAQVVTTYKPRYQGAP